MIFKKNHPKIEEDFLNKFFKNLNDLIDAKQDRLCNAYAMDSKDMFGQLYIYFNVMHCKRLKI